MSSREGLYINMILIIRNQFKNNILVNKKSETLPVTLLKLFHIFYVDVFLHNIRN